MTPRYQFADAVERDAVMPLVERLFNRWKLDAQLRDQLLSGGRVPHDADQAKPSASIERARRLLDIHAGLGLLFPENPELRWTWIARKNGALEGMTPLEVMLEGEAGVDRVLQLIRQDVAS